VDGHHFTVLGDLQTYIHDNGFGYMGVILCLRLAFRKIVSGYQKRRRKTPGV
jgi:hypothetical protein